MLNVIILNFVMLNVIKLSADEPNVIMLNVVMLSVVAPLRSAYLPHRLWRKPFLNIVTAINIVGLNAEHFYNYVECRCAECRYAKCHGAHLIYPS